MPEAASGPDLSQLRIDRGPASQPRPRGGAVKWVVGGLLLIGLGWLGISLFGGGLFDRRVPVELGRVQKVGGAAALSGTAANGYVVARRQAALSTDIEGRLVELKVEEGDRVRSGDLIARLDTRQLEAALERTKGDLASAAATAQWAQLDFERKDKLLPQGDISVSEVDLARVARDEAEARARALEAAQAEIEVLLSKSSVFAPFDGVITAKNAEIGEVVSSISSGVNSRGSVATLVDFATLEVQVELAQTSLKAAREGAPVQIFLDAYPDQGYAGRVRQVWPTADRQKATVELRAEFLERDERILPEMGVRVVFVPESQAPQEPAVMVPERALTGEPPAVFVFDGTRVVRQPVTLGAKSAAGKREVTQGLVGGEMVVLDPPPALADGDEVRERTE
jgi:HlyD family secretion protein